MKDATVTIAINVTKSCLCPHYCVTKTTESKGLKLEPRAGDKVAEVGLAIIADFHLTN